MKKIMGCIILLMVFLVGCQTNEEIKPSSVKTEPKKESNIKKQNPIDPSKPDLNAVDYRVKLNKFVDEFDVIATEYAKTFPDDKIQMENEEWRKNATNLLERLESISNDLLTVETTSKYNEVHHIMKRALPGFLDASHALKDAIAKKDIYQFISGKSLMTKASNEYVKISPFLRVFDGQTNPSEGNDKIPYDPTKDPKNYNKNGEYRPVDEMTPEETRKELEGYIEDYINKK